MGDAAPGEEFMEDKKQFPPCICKEAFSEVLHLNRICHSSDPFLFYGDLFLSPQNIHYKALKASTAPRLCAAGRDKQQPFVEELQAWILGCKDICIMRVTKKVQRTCKKIGVLLRRKVWVQTELCCMTPYAIRPQRDCNTSLKQNKKESNWHFEWTPSSMTNQLSMAGQFPFLQWPWHLHTDAFPQDS